MLTQSLFTCIANYGKDGVMCSRFEGLYDMAANTSSSIMHIEICHLQRRSSAQKCPGGTGLRDAGCFARSFRSKSQRSLSETYRPHGRLHRKHILQRRRARLHDDRIKILVVGHSYNLYDEYIGKPILKGLNSWMPFRSAPMQWI